MKYSPPRAAASGALRASIGPLILPALWDDPKALARVLDRVNAWNPETPDNYSPGWKFESKGDLNAATKSMHTAESARRKGAGGAMLRHLISTARECGMTHLSLETGSSAYFRPAHAFYQSHGFVECSPFANYIMDPNSRFFALDLRSIPVG